MEWLRHHQVIMPGEKAKKYALPWTVVGGNFHVPDRLLQCGALWAVRHSGGMEKPSSLRSKNICVKKVCPVLSLNWAVSCNRLFIWHRCRPILGSIRCSLFWICRVQNSCHLFLIALLKGGLRSWKGMWNNVISFKRAEAAALSACSLPAMASYYRSTQAPGLVNNSSL